MPTPSDPSLLSASSRPGLDALRGLRTAPAPGPQERAALRQELAAALAPCAWFTVGVMAPSAAAAVAALRQLEEGLAWRPLAIDAVPADEAVGTAFLKGNQRTGSALVRWEPGLGEGILITGHQPDDPSVEDTWGPLPLDLFSPATAAGAASADA
jgi:hypothetical protein